MWRRWLSGRGPGVRGPTVKKIALRLFLGRGQPEQRPLCAILAKEPDWRGGARSFFLKFVCRKEIHIFVQTTN
jgi:hypothetical protein